MEMSGTVSASWSSHALGEAGHLYPDGGGILWGGTQPAVGVWEGSEEEVASAWPGLCKEERGLRGLLFPLTQVWTRLPVIHPCSEGRGRRSIWVREEEVKL